ncbi:hypothetical protein FRX31_024137, partial [Thalictrum thalictroides]
MAEGHAILYGLKLANDLNIQNLIIQTDSQVLRDAIQNGTKDRKLQTVTHQCRLWMKKIVQVKLQKIYREGNVVADALAKEALTRTGLVESLDMDSFMDIILAECS